MKKKINKREKLQQKFLPNFSNIELQQQQQQQLREKKLINFLYLARSFFSLIEYEMKIFILKNKEHSFIPREQKK